MTERRAVNERRAVTERWASWCLNDFLSCNLITRVYSRKVLFHKIFGFSSIVNNCCFLPLKISLWQLICDYV